MIGSCLAARFQGCAARSGAFTLVEMLVTMAVAAGLGALLLTGVASANRSARGAQCINNLRQAGIALAIYVDEQKAFPLATAGNRLGAWQKPLQLQGNRLVCPESRRATREFLEVFPAGDPVIHPHYGYNFGGAVRRNPPPFNLGLGGDFVWQGTAGAYAPTAAARVRVPAQMVALGDSPAFVRPPVSMSESIQPADLLYISFPYEFAAYGYAGAGDWHGGKANFVFCDGHVASEKQSVWQEALPERRRVWNNDHEPHEQSW